MIRSIFPTVWCLVYLAVLVGLAFAGGIKVNKRPLSPLPALLVGPLLCLVIGVLFTVVGLLFLSPLWIWLPFLRF